MMFVFGAIIGSFLNVVLYRMHTGRSLSGRSHCMSCGKELAWFELFPVLSYICLRGACRGCSAYIPSRYLIVELTTGFLFATVWHLLQNDISALVFHLFLITLCVVIVVYDIRHTIIPNELTGVLILMALLLIGYEYALTREFSYVLFRFTAGLSGAAFFFALWYISKGKWIGLGDAKLALPLGMIVGIGGVFSMVVLSFWIGAVVSVSLIALERLMKRGKVRLHFLSTPLTIKSEVPFAPFLILGFLAVQLFHADTFDITYTLFFSH